MDHRKIKTDGRIPPGLIERAVADTNLSRRDLTKLIVLSGLGLSVPGAWAQGVGGLDAEFKDWMQQQENEFQAFQAFHKQALKDYVAGVTVNWGANPVLRNRKRWVDYDKNTRRIVDFDKGFAEVTVIKKQNQSVPSLTKRIKRVMHQLFKASVEKIIAADPLEQAVKKHLQRSLAIVTDVVKKGIQAAPAFAAVVPELSAIEQAVAKEEKLPNGKTAVTIRVPINNDPAAKRAPFLNTIKKQSERYLLSPALVGSITEAESAFNPLATSRAPAYGLMQVVPTSAGLDVTSYLYKKRSLLSPEWLYDASNNILAGSTYLHLLYARYLKGIEDIKSKMYCAIASYNAGTGNMAKAFDRGGVRRAIVKINRQSPEQVYSTLIKKLPYQETKDYLEKVTGYIANWVD